MIEQKLAVVLIQLLGFLFDFFFFPSCSFAPRNADLQRCLYFDVPIHSSASWTGRFPANRNCLNVQGSP